MSDFRITIEAIRHPVAMAHLEEHLVTAENLRNAVGELEYRLNKEARGQKQRGRICGFTVLSAIMTDSCYFASPHSTP